MTDQEPIRPASDAVVAALRVAADEYRSAPGKTRFDNLVWGIAALIARIEADAATIREAAEIADENVFLRAENAAQAEELDQLRVFKALVLQHLTPVTYETITAGTSNRADEQATI